MNKSIEKRKKNEEKNDERIYGFKLFSVSHVKGLWNILCLIVIIVSTILFIILPNICFCLPGFILYFIIFFNGYSGSDFDRVIIKGGLIYFENRCKNDSFNFTVYKVEKVIVTKCRIKIYGDIDKYDNIKGYSLKVKKVSILNALDRGEDFIRDARALISDKK